MHPSPFLFPVAEPRGSEVPHLPRRHHRAPLERRDEQAGPLAQGECLAGQSATRGPDPISIV